MGRRNKEGFWGLQSYLYECCMHAECWSLAGYICEYSLILTLKICILSACMLNLNLEINDFNKLHK